MPGPMAFRAASATSSIAMQTEEEAHPQYDGPFCEISRDGVFYVVAIEPRLAGAGEPQSYTCKSVAWGQMLAWAQQFRLPVRDLTNPKVGPRD